MKTNLKSFALGASLALGLLGVYALALSIPNGFTAGDVISAAKMNANFDALRAAVTALESNTNVAAATSIKVTASINTQTNTTAKTFAQFTVTTPGPGKLVVNLSVPMYMNLGAPPAGGTLKVGLCDAADTGTAAACADTYYDTLISPSVQFYSVADVSRTRVFNVAAAGPKTIFVNAQTDSATHPLSFNQSGTASLTFIPNTAALSITSLKALDVTSNCTVAERAQGRC
jgi:hypothetical protein